MLGYLKGLFDDWLSALLIKWRIISTDVKVWHNAIIEVFKKHPVITKVVQRSPNVAKRPPLHGRMFHSFMAFIE